MVCSGFIEPLNLQCLLVNTLSGTEIIFIILAFVFISFMAAKLRMRNGVGFIMIGLFATMFATLVSGLSALIILIGGIIMFTVLRRLVSTQ